MAFELSCANHDLFANELVLHKSVLISHALASAFLHEFCTQHFCMPTILHEDSIRLDKVFVPEEDVVLMAMTDCSKHATPRAFNDFDDLVDCQSVIVLVTAIECTVTRRLGYFLAQVDYFDTDNLALFIDHL